MVVLYMPSLKKTHTNYCCFTYVYMCHNSEGNGLQLHPATSSPSSRQDYWHSIPLPLAEIARTQGQSTRIWELPWACVCECVVCVFTRVWNLCKWSWFPPRCWALWLRQWGQCSLLSHTCSQMHIIPVCFTHLILQSLPLLLTEVSRNRKYVIYINAHFVLYLYRGFHNETIVQG